VLPFYNPGDAVARTITDLGDAMRRAGIRHQVLAVSDGSTDDSAASVAALADPAVELIELPLNQGKGAAVRTGFARATGEYVAFIDADGDIAPSHLVDYLERARRRPRPRVRVQAPPRCGVGGHGRTQGDQRGFSTFVSCLFRLGSTTPRPGPSCCAASSPPTCSPGCRSAASPSTSSCSSWPAGVVTGPLHAAGAPRRASPDSP
jgi:hypothetical protein